MHYLKFQKALKQILLPISGQTEWSHSQPFSTKQLTGLPWMPATHEGCWLTLGGQTSIQPGSCSQGAHELVGSFNVNKQKSILIGQHMIHLEGVSSNKTLDEWFSTEAVFPLRTFLVVKHTLGADSTEWVGTRVTAKLSTLHKTKGFLSKNINSSKVERPCSRWWEGWKTPGTLKVREDNDQS